jgi:hypothetical protein
LGVPGPRVKALGPSHTQLTFSAPVRVTTAAPLQPDAPGFGIYTALGIVTMVGIIGGADDQDAGLLTVESMRGCSLSRFHGECQASVRVTTESQSYPLLPLYPARSCPILTLATRHKHQDRRLTVRDRPSEKGNSMDDARKAAALYGPTHPHRFGQVPGMNGQPMHTTWKGPGRTRHPLTHVRAARPTGGRVESGDHPAPNMRTTRKQRQARIKRNRKLAEQHPAPHGPDFPAPRYDCLAPDAHGLGADGVRETSRPSIRHCAHTLNSVPPPREASDSAGIAG